MSPRLVGLVEQVGRPTDCAARELLGEAFVLDAVYNLPDPTWEDDRLIAAKNTNLKTLFDRGVRKFLYTYDMGEHIVTLEAVRHGKADTKYPRYVDGERRAPPKDCGGTPGFEAFLEAIAGPKLPEHMDVTEWRQGCYGKAFDPETIDDLNAKLSIRAIAKRRAAGKASQAKKSR